MRVWQACTPSRPCLWRQSTCHAAACTACGSSASSGVLFQPWKISVNVARKGPSGMQRVTLKVSFHLANYAMGKKASAMAQTVRKQRIMWQWCAYQAGPPHGGGVHNGRHLHKVVQQDLVEQCLIPVLRAHTAQITDAKSHEHRLSRHGHDVDVMPSRHWAFSSVVLGAGNATQDTCPARSPQRGTCTRMSCHVNIMA